MTRHDCDPALIDPNWMEEQLTGLDYDCLHSIECTVKVELYFFNVSIQWTFVSQPLKCATNHTKIQIFITRMASAVHMSSVHPWGHSHTAYSTCVTAASTPWGHSHTAYSTCVTASKYSMRPLTHCLQYLCDRKQVLDTFHVERQREPGECPFHSGGKSDRSPVYWH